MSPQDRVNYIIEIPQGKLITELTGELISLGTVVNGDITPRRVAYSEVNGSIKFPYPGSKWCKRSYVTDCGLDMSEFL